MPHNISLITTIAAALGFGLIFGMLAVRLRMPALVGYIVAGIIIGPATPGFVGDVALASQLAEIGVMLLMFGVGLHFSIDDLLEVRAIALPGALLQISVATAMGIVVAHLWGWGLGAGLVFGLAVSVQVQWCCCGRWRTAASLTPSTGASPSAGWWSKTW